MNGKRNSVMLFFAVLSPDLGFMVLPDRPHVIRSSSRSAADQSTDNGKWKGALEYWTYSHLRSIAFHVFVNFGQPFQQFTGFTELAHPHGQLPRSNDGQRQAEFGPEKLEFRLLDTATVSTPNSRTTLSNRAPVRWHPSIAFRASSDASGDSTWIPIRDLNRARPLQPHDRFAGPLTLPLVRAPRRSP